MSSGEWHRSYAAILPACRPDETIRGATSATAGSSRWSSRSPGKPSGGMQSESRNATNGVSASPSPVLRAAAAPRSRRGARSGPRTARRRAAIAARQASRRRRRSSARLPDERRQAALELLRRPRVRARRSSPRRRPRAVAVADLAGRGRRRATGAPATARHDPHQLAGQPASARTVRAPRSDSVISRGGEPPSSTSPLRPVLNPREGRSRHPTGTGTSVGGVKRSIRHRRAPPRRSAPTPPARTARPPPRRSRRARSAGGSGADRRTPPRRGRSYSPALAASIAPRVDPGQIALADTPVPARSAGRAPGRRRPSAALAAEYSGELRHRPQRRRRGDRDEPPGTGLTIPGTVASASRRVPCRLTSIRLDHASSLVAQAGPARDHAGGRHRRGRGPAAERRRQPAGELLAGHVGLEHLDARELRRCPHCSATRSRSAAAGIAYSIPG